MFINGRHFFSHLELLSKGFKVEPHVRHCVSTKQSNLKIEIPKRIERGPTDILKALAETVKKDFTAFHYKYPDDPFFYATSNLYKRKFALSLESGRKSARWVFENHSEFFNSNAADPAIQKFIPKPVYDENSEVTEETLKGVIEEKNVSDAIILYKIFKKKGIDITKETEQLLLELVCFYNSDEKKNEEELEVKWFQKSNKKSLVMKTWKNNGFAEELFQSMGSECPLACAAIIQGRLKYNEVEKALELFEREKEEKNLPVGVYNWVLRHVNNIVEGYDRKSDFIKKILKEMEEKNILPDLNTLNSVLETLSQMARWYEAENFALKIIAEFKQLGIEPSLGSYYYVFMIMFNGKEPSTKKMEFLEETLTSLHNLKLEVKHPSDMYFFSYTMFICATALKDCYLGNLLNSLLWKSDNVKFLNENFEENIYFKHYINLMFEAETIEHAMEIYKTLVPTVYCPEVSVYLSILSAIEKSHEFTLLIQIWKDIKQQRHQKNFVALNGVLNLVPFYTGKEGDEIWKVFHEAAINTNEGNKKNELNGVITDSTLSNMFISFLKNEDEENALNIFKEVYRESDLLDLSAFALKIFCNHCISKKKFSLLLDCLKYAEIKNYVEVTEMANLALPYLSNLDASDLKWVNELANKSKLDSSE